MGQCVKDLGEQIKNTQTDGEVLCLRGDPVSLPLPPPPLPSPDQLTPEELPAAGRTGSDRG